MVINQSCRTFDFEQLLFLEIFELLQKFGSNLSFKLDGNYVISMNSVHRSCYTAGDLRFASRRGRGRLWRRAGVEEAHAWLPCASEPRYKDRDAVVVVFLPPLFSPAAIAILR